MTMFNFSFMSRKPKTAEAAKERLQILVAHDRASSGSADFLQALQKEILEVVRKHVTVNRDQVDIRLDEGQDISSLEINIELPPKETMVKPRHA